MKILNCSDAGVVEIICKDKVELDSLNKVRYGSGSIAMIPITGALDVYMLNDERTEWIKIS